MTKTLTLNKQQTVNMNDWIKNFDQKFADGGLASSGSPDDTMRAKFRSAAQEQIKAIKSGEAKGKWFSKEASGAYKVILRNGNKKVVISGKDYRLVPDANAAVTMLEQVIQGVMEGHLDEQLKAARIAKVPKAKKAE